MNTDTGEKLHRGSCHCGNVQFEVSVNALHGSRCNCRICTKLGVLSANVKPSAFRLLTDESKLASYSRFPEIANRYFCSNCHTLCFGKGDIPEVGGAFVSVNLNTLDDIDPAQVAVVYWDGRHDNWQAGPRAEPWPIN